VTSAPDVAARLRGAAKATARRVGVAKRDTHTELIIEVPCAAALVQGWPSRGRRKIGWRHVTVLDPFVPSFVLDRSAIATVREVLSGFQPFAYRLARIDRFPGVLYAAPEPAEPFVAITEALWRRFPEYPPYGGAFDEIVPHVTLALGDEPAGLTEHVLERLPVDGRVEEVVLMMESPDGRWHAAERFALGGRAWPQS